MYVLSHVPVTHIFLGNHTAAKAQSDEVVALADEKGALFWKAEGMMNQGRVLVVDRQSLGRGSGDHHRADHIPVNGSNSVVTLSFVIFGEGLCGCQPIR